MTRLELYILLDTIGMPNAYKMIEMRAQLLRGYGAPPDKADAKDFLKCFLLEKIEQPGKNASLKSLAEFYYAE